MNWAERWARSTGGQTGQVTRVVRGVTKKLKLDRGVSLLDVGCGSGSLLKKLPAKKKVGLDYSERLLIQARRRGLRVIKGTAWKLPFADNSFNRVLCYSVTHYLTHSQAEEALKELKRVCKPRGFVLVGDVADVDYYRFGRLMHDLVREPLLSFFGVTRTAYFSRDWFLKKGFAISSSAYSKKRFDALFTKEF
ncbi:methyltransferase domain-containing protein [Candidatus Micrarchaeota archaeon]|nr:methyltransferase domain-containing protein [Candidatus Micrarchaeota archaeon]